MTQKYVCTPEPPPRLGLTLLSCTRTSLTSSQLLGVCVGRVHSKPGVFKPFRGRAALASTHGLVGRQYLQIIFYAIQFKTQFQMDNVYSKYEFIVQ
jgi:hypothetical protein